MRKSFRFLIFSASLVFLAALFAAQLPASQHGAKEHGHERVESHMSGMAAGNPMLGEKTYEAKCAGCHGKGGTGGFAPRHVGCNMCGDLPALIHEIESDMPKGSAGECVGECAVNTATYIYVKLNGNSL